MWHSTRPRHRLDQELVGGSDAELLAAIGQERLDALRLLHQRHAPWLKARLSRRCADPDSGVPDAEAAATAVHVARSTRVPARAAAAVAEFAISRRRAALYNRDAAGTALHHLRPGPTELAALNAAAEGAAHDETLGHWLDGAPYGPRDEPPCSTVYRY